MPLNLALLNSPDFGVHLLYSRVPEALPQLGVGPNGVWDERNLFDQAPNL